MPRVTLGHRTHPFPYEYAFCQQKAVYRKKGGKVAHGGQTAETAILDFGGWTRNVNGSPNATFIAAVLFVAAGVVALMAPHCVRLAEPAPMDRKRM